MFLRELIILGNSNITIALAYINQSENPLIVFCNLISYSLACAEKKSLGMDDLLNDIEDRFGLKLPIHIIKACARILKKQGQLKIVDKTNYCLEKSTFDIEKFDNECIQRKIREENVIEDLKNYVITQGKDWSTQETKQKFTDFLLKEENAYNLFVYNNLSINHEQKYISDDWYISNYLSKLLEEKNSYYDFVLEIVKGIMIYVGLCQFDDYNQSYNEKFKDTNFFIDTKLLLRYLGYSWTVAAQESQELMNLIKEEYGGRLCIFEHTYKEAEIALHNEVYALKYDKDENIELKYFRVHNKYDADRFEIDEIALRRTIEEKYHIEIVNNIDWSSKDTIDNNLDWVKLTQFFECKFSAWNKQALHNDITSINYINVLRKGDYSSKFGGRKKLPIFITTNYPLISGLRDYISNEQNTNSFSFDYNNMPVIADSTIMYRLWLPKASKAQNVPALKLARTVYAAQQEDTRFYEKLKNNIKSFDNEMYSIDDLAEKYSRNLYELVAKNADGSYENMTDEVIASSLEEFIEITSLQKDEEINTLKEYNVSAQSLIEEQREELIAAYAQNHIKNIGFLSTLFILAGKYWWIITCVISFILTLLFTELKTNNKIPLFIGVIIFVLPLLNKIIEKFLSQKLVTNFIKRWAIKKAKVCYINRVLKRLTTKEINYKDEIIEYCINNIPNFNE